MASDSFKIVLDEDGNNVSEAKLPEYPQKTEALHEHLQGLSNKQQSANLTDREHGWRPPGDAVLACPWSGGRRGDANAIWNVGDCANKLAVYNDGYLDGGKKSHAFIACRGCQALACYKHLSLVAVLSSCHSLGGGDMMVCNQGSH
ncbi:hypothetical protein PVAP13_2KG374205 [Panicum virgatum]|uniref:Uncharacterized protein n=1 Tax=Panicum virgatum TaxID=38727 RepID=A0A8T0W838_PANVG|nr:hypothetical protein PVAP13_2KG374205 [Panicum virgatum]